MPKIEVSSSKKQQMIDITGEINRIVADSGVKEGVCIVFVPHTTAAVTINENADPDVVHDVIKKLLEVTSDANYRHAECNSDAHVTSTIVGASETLIIEDNRLVLGTWQGIMFIEFDGPRKRTVYIKIIKG